MDTPYLAQVRELYERTKAGCPNGEAEQSPRSQVLSDLIKYMEAEKRDDIPKKVFLPSQRPIFPDSLDSSDGAKLPIHLYQLSCGIDSNRKISRYLDMRDLMEAIQADRIHRARRIYIIQNISPACIEAMGSELQIDPFFFADHISNADLCVTKADPMGHNDEGEAEKSLQVQHLNGFWRLNEASAIPWDHMYDFAEAHCFYAGRDADERILRNFNLHRPRERDGQEVELPYGRDISYTQTIATRITYFSVDSSIRVFLTDNLGCGTLKTNITKIALKFWSLAHPHGICIREARNWPPTMASWETAGIVESMLAKYDQGFELMYADDRVPPGSSVLHMMAYHVWSNWLEGIARGADRTHVKDVKRADGPNQTKSLHILREELILLRENVGMIIEKTGPSTVEYFAKLAQTYQFELTKLPIHGFQRVLDRATSLNDQLIESFQLLMNTMSIQESRISAQQAQSSLILTRLAAVYLPLSLAVGVFGMNLEELNSSGQPVKVFVITSLVICIATVIGFNIRSITKRLPRKVQSRSLELFVAIETLFYVEWLDIGFNRSMILRVYKYIYYKRLNELLPAE